MHLEESILRNSILLFFMLVGLSSACGSKPKKTNDDLYVIESEQHKKVSFMFFDKNNELISKSQNDFPVGAYEAKVFVNSGVQISKATFTTCCGKTIEINYSEKDENGITLLKDFNLGNAKHKLNLDFEDGDVAILSKESL